MAAETVQFLSIVLVSHKVLSVEYPFPSNNRGFDVIRSADYYWPFDAVQNGVVEELNSGRVGTVNGSVVTTSAVVNDGILLDGGANFVTLGDFSGTCVASPSLCAQTGLSVSVWWKNSEPISRQCITSGGKGLSDGLSLYTISPAFGTEFYIRSGNTLWMAAFPSPSDTWTHFVFTWTQADTIEVWQDGVKLAAPITTTVGTNYGDVHNNLVVGTNNDQSYDEYCTGSFDELAIWGRKLTDPEVLYYYQASTGTVIGVDTVKTEVDTLTNATYEKTTELLQSLLAVTVPGTHLLDTDITEAVSVLEKLSTLLPDETVGTNNASDLSQMFFEETGQLMSALNQYGWGNMTQYAKDSTLSDLSRVTDQFNIHLGSHVASPGTTTVLSAGDNGISNFSVTVRPAAVLQHDDYVFPDGDSDTTIEIPASIVNYNIHEARTIVAVLYHNFHQRYSTNNSLGVDPSEASLNSLVVSATLSPSPPLPLQDNITVSFTHLEEAEDTTRRWCVHLDLTGDVGVWSDEGCVILSTNSNRTVCSCNHMTNYAILMQVVDVQVDHGNRVALQVITYVGCGLSIICLFVSIIVFLGLSSIQADKTHAHVNLCVCLLLAQMLFLIGSGWTPGTVVCKVFAVLLHYIYLAAFAWMLVEGIHLYNVIIRVFTHVRLLYYYLIGWGLPLLVCIVSVSIAHSGYGEKDNCWLSTGGGVIWAFVAPALVIIMVNAVILILVTREVVKLNNISFRVKPEKEKSSFKSSVRAVAVLLPILGISWIFGVLAVNEAAVVFQYIFALTNSSQGLFIFLFHCALNSEVRQAFKRRAYSWSVSRGNIPGRVDTVRVKPFDSDVIRPESQSSTKSNKKTTTPELMPSVVSTTHLPNLEFSDPDVFATPLSNMDSSAPQPIPRRKLSRMPSTEV
ncbi:adhesion G-protein coupled receptor D1-like [Branchiostoma floridae]|uniref:Adhesion G-protein coupled receptor D1-like n=1 Tax=Branchiostoma floridae TaxID=7739 RepID=A0A9J7MYY4_BRAFL|nr:adhesion G-protein coupled receptor D1-like [Branchiostoma floridae]